MREIYKNSMKVVACAGAGLATWAGSNELGESIRADNYSDKVEECAGNLGGVATITSASIPKVCRQFAVNFPREHHTTTVRVENFDGSIDKEITSSTTKTRLPSAATFREERAEERKKIEDMSMIASTSAGLIMGGWLFVLTFKPQINNRSRRKWQNEQTS